MKDLTNYSSNELSLQVYNDRYFYTERGQREYLLALVAEEFWYTDEQLKVLIEDLDNEIQDLKDLILEVGGHNLPSGMAT